MEAIYGIPVKYKEGIYGANELNMDEENVIKIHYSDYGDIVTYKLPDREYGEIRLYGIEKNVLDLTLKATYDANGHLKMLTVNRENKEELLYVYYENAKKTKKEIEKFAYENVNSILDKISTYKEVVSRLFVEYFNDGECMDFHVKIGTETEKTALEKKYPQYKDIGDSCGDYSSEILCGDNDRLKVMVSCADNDEFDYFQHAVDIMVQLIEEKAPHLLNKSDDFKLLCAEYD
ncbi:MAG: hypothetical protein IJA10_05940 [Lachnospiraceae bacterium]|nr:hypothetical protein [Lachnospiraceae bacterium]